VDRCGVLDVESRLQTVGAESGLGDAVGVEIDAEPVGWGVRFQRAQQDFAAAAARVQNLRFGPERESLDGRVDRHLRHRIREPQVGVSDPRSAGHAAERATSTNRRDVRLESRLAGAWGGRATAGRLEYLGGARLQV
jgi:hypothetical protein